jgi:hypothetical protein
MELMAAEAAGGVVALAEVVDRAAEHPYQEALSPEALYQEALSPEAPWRLDAVNAAGQMPPVRAQAAAAQGPHGRQRVQNFPVVRQPRG